MGAQFREVEQMYALKGLAWWYGWGISAAPPMLEASSALGMQFVPMQASCRAWAGAAGGADCGAGGVGTTAAAAACIGSGSTAWQAVLLEAVGPRCCLDRVAPDSRRVAWQSSNVLQ